MLAEFELKSSLRLELRFSWLIKLDSVINEPSLSWDQLILCIHKFITQAWIWALYCLLNQAELWLQLEMAWLVDSPTSLYEFLSPTKSSKILNIDPTNFKASQHARQGQKCSAAEPAFCYHAIFNQDPVTILLYNSLRRLMITISIKQIYYPNIY